MATEGSSKQRITIERIYRTTVDQIWDKWTTKEGLESWWGPVGFTTEVRSIELRPGGNLKYALTATGPDQVEFMKNVGMPLTTEARLTYSIVVEKTHIAYVHIADFVPGIEPYDVATDVRFSPVDDRVRLVITLDPMHDEEWTQRMTMGMESQLERLSEFFG